MSRHKDKRRLRKLNIKFLALTGSPAHGEPTSILKSMNAKPCIKGEVFEDENKEELDIQDSIDKENLSSANIGLEVRSVADSLDEGTINQDDAIVRLREITENIDNNIDEEPDKEDKVLSYSELKQLINI